MRTSVYTFFLITCLLLMPYAVLAGTDDSGLQVFTVDFSQQLGEMPEVAQEDTKIAAYCFNLFNSGNGLCSFPEPNGTGYEWPGAATDIVDSPLGYNFVRLNGASLSTAQIYCHVNPNLSPPNGSRSLITSASYDYLNSEMTQFTIYNASYLFLGNKFIKVTGSWTSPTTSEITLPAVGKTATLWKNRLFFSSGNTIYYSAPQNFEDFSNTPTTGGTTNIYECNQIIKLVGTKYGLYIFTDNGIFLQSGTGAKASWNIEKISNVNAMSWRTITAYNDNIFFISWAYNGNKVFVVNGSTVEPFFDFMTDIFVISGGYYGATDFLQIVDNGNMLCFFSATTGQTTWIYDMQRKTFIRNYEFNGGGSSRYYIKKTTNGYKIYEYFKKQKINNTFSYTLLTSFKTVYPWIYQTSWFTLDGNASNRKEIDRIEFDYQGGTTNVYLYYAYGNGLTRSNSTLLTAPTNSRVTTFVWNDPISKQQSNRFYLYFISNGTQTMTTNYVLKQARIYYRNVGNYKTNSLR